MRIKKFGFHSPRRLKQFQITAIVILLVLSILLSAVYCIMEYSSISKKIIQSETDIAEKHSSQIEGQWIESINICSSLTSLRIPSSELNAANNYYAARLLAVLQDSHTKNQIVDNIEVTYDNTVFSHSKLDHHRRIDQLFPFDVYIEEYPKWPYCFDLVLSQNRYLNPVTITINAFALSKEVFSSGSLRMEYYVASDGTILLTSSQNDFFKNLSTLHPNLLDMLSDEMCSVAYGDYFCTSTPVNQYGFRLISLVHKDAYLGSYRAFWSQASFLIITLLAIVIALSIFLTQKYYRPLSAAIDMLRTYAPGDLQKYETELKFVVDKLSFANQSLQIPVVQGLSNIQNAQTAALQNQINAHFLFNTLENIKSISISELGIDNEIENSIILLNSIIHESIITKTSIIPLSQELQLARCYLQLMQLRFPNIEIQWSIDKQIPECHVFKFSLQPILENCFVHAFQHSNNIRANCISIEVHSERSDIIISISDNGDGMDMCTLESLQNRLRHCEGLDDYSHIGILNVHRRITTVFGDNYGISVKSTSEGTTVTIRYPVISTLDLPKSDS